MNRGLNIFLVILIIIGFLFAGGVFYIIDETQQVVLTQFGELVDKPITKPGLYFKIPFIQTANYFDNRVLQWDGDADQMPTLDKRFIWVDTMARWKIVDPLQFMQAVRTEAGAQTRLDDLIDASTRAVISSHILIEAIRDTNGLIERQDKLSDDYEFGATELVPVQFGREDLNKKILNRAKDTIRQYGIELVDVRIKRINYVQEVQNKVYERMISERKRAAEKFRSEGQGKKAEIEGQMLKELEQIQSEAYKKAQEIKGKADAEAIKIYAEAYNKDPEFYSFIKTLETYRKTVNKDTNLIFTTKNEFYGRLNGIGGHGLDVN